VTTHPEVVRAVVGQLQSVTDRVVIGESPGGPYNRGVLKRSYERTGMTRVAEETGAALNFDVTETQVALPGAEKMKRLVLCRRWWRQTGWSRSQSSRRTSSWG